MKTLALATVAAAVVPMVAVVGIAATSAGTSTELLASSCSVGDAVPDAVAALGLVSEAAANAITIYTVTVERGLPQRAAVIAIATAMQESSLHNYGDLGDANDHDSLGLFQQRPSQGWGTPEQLTDPEYATGKFLDKLVTIDGWESLPVTVAAQAVQNSAYPDAYADDEPLAQSIVAVLATNTSCGLSVSDQGFTHPVPDGSAGSGYRTSDRPDHDGVDFMAPRGADIHAAGAGTVITVLCNANTASGEAYSCDVDGGVDIYGCGWYVEVLHNDDTVTRYCHMGQRPLVSVGDKVTAGTTIGHVGSSGNSSGPHLHFEAHTAQPATSANATDPLAYLTERGVNAT